MQKICMTLFESRMRLMDDLTLKLKRGLCTENIRTLFMHVMTSDDNDE